MHVFLTVDVESYTGDYERDVYAGGLGLDYILCACRDAGLRATFFVEALGATRWGPDPLRSLCSRILNAGHDVQLHVHPSAARIDGFIDRQDLLSNQDPEDQRMLIERGRSILKECGAEKITAFRAGDLAADAHTLDAMRSAGLFLGSNRDLDLKSSIRSKINDLFPVRNDASRYGGIVDIPVSVLRSSLPWLDGTYRHMEISAMGCGEMQQGLRGMQRAGYATACILTHPREFFRFVEGRPRPIAKNCRRLRSVLRFLASEPGFSVQAFGEGLDDISLPGKSPPEIRTNPLLQIFRIVEQAVDRLAWTL